MKATAASSCDRKKECVSLRIRVLLLQIIHVCVRVPLVTANAKKKDLGFLNSFENKKKFVRCKKQANA